MKVLLIIFSIIGLLTLVSLFLKLMVLAIKNNINKYVGNKCEKHYHEIQSNVSCGICDWLYLIPTIKSSISGGFFEIEVDIFVFYLFVSYKIIDIDDEK